MISWRGVWTLPMARYWAFWKKIWTSSCTCHRLNVIGFFPCVSRRLHELSDARGCASVHFKPAFNLIPFPAFVLFRQYAQYAVCLVCEHTRLGLAVRQNYSAVCCQQDWFERAEPESRLHLSVYFQRWLPLSSVNLFPAISDGTNVKIRAQGTRDSWTSSRSCPFSRELP